MTPTHIIHMSGADYYIFTWYMGPADYFVLEAQSSIQNELLHMYLLKGTLDITSASLSRQSSKILGCSPASLFQSGFSPVVQSCDRAHNSPVATQNYFGSCINRIMYALGSGT